VAGAADETATRSLRHRWDALISRERHYRNAPAGPQTLARAAVNEA